SSGSRRMSASSCARSCGGSSSTSGGVGGLRIPGGIGSGLGRDGGQTLGQNIGGADRRQIFGVGLLIYNPGHHQYFFDLIESCRGHYANVEKQVFARLNRDDPAHRQTL